MSRGTRAIIHADALAYNLNRIRSMTPDSKIWAVVKANAYGHGAVKAARALKSADGFAVATLDEAMELRDNDIDHPILLLEGCVNAEQLKLSAAQNFEIVFHHPSQFSWLSMLPKGQSINLWIKIDTGMHRLGLDPDQVPDMLNPVKNHPGIRSISFMSHFASSDLLSEPLNQVQIDRFETFSHMGLPCSFANSAAIWNFPESHFEWVRPGIALYGASPFADKSAAQIGLKPAMTLASKVIAERWIDVGESAGYGGRWRAKRRTKLATVALGYGDGYPRHAPDGTPVWISGMTAPLAGRVSMDMITVDTTDLPGSQMNQDVELWGNNLPVDEVAEHVGTIGYELLTRVSPRVPRI